MTQSKTILISTLASSLLVLAGCTTQTTTNTNVVSNTNTTVNANTSNDNTNVVVANSNENTNEVVNENTNSGQGGEVDTSDWLTYTNDEYGFSFKYPKEWDILVGSKFTEEFDIPTSMAIGGLDHHPSYGVSRGVFAVYFNVVPIEQGISLNDWFETTDLYTSKEEINKQDSGFSPSVDSVDTSIDGTDARDQVTGGEGGGMREVFIQKNNYVYIYTISVNGDYPNYRNPSLNDSLNGNKVLENFNELLDTIQIK